MVQVQITIEMNGDDRNGVNLHIFEREDAKDLEREFAQHIESLFISIFQQVQDECGFDAVTITEIHK